MLVGACGSLGARVAGGTDSASEALGVFGERLGIAFQIRDDVFDLDGDAAVVGKSVGRDLAKGKMTLPMILLLDGADSTVFSEAVDAFRSRDPEAVLRLLKEGDAITRAIKFATEQVDDAKDAIAGVPLGGTEALLDDLADAVVARDR